MRTSPTLAQPQTGLSVIPSAAQPSATALPAATDTPTPTPSQTPTPTQASTSAILAFQTTTPGIAATLTAIFSTPGAQETMTARQTMEAATAGPLMQGFSTSLLSQCPNPADPPMQTWVDIPVMPQATAGQVVQTLIGSYYCFRAPVTVEQIETFYKDKLPPPNWVLQSSANGSMVFAGLSQAGALLLFLVSGPGNKSDLLVAINVTKSLPLPTP